MTNEIITSRQNPRVKAAASLSDKKSRRKAGLFRFDGIKLFGEALGRVCIDSVFVRYPESEDIARSIKKAIDMGFISDGCVFYLSETVFEKLTEESSPEGIVTVARYADELHTDASESTAAELKGKRLLILESVRDPGNLGTVMRSCAALGIETLVMSDDCADIYNPKTLRSAMGAVFKLPTVSVKTAELPGFISELRKIGRKVYAAALCEGAKKIGEFNIYRDDCFVIGNEGHGLSNGVVGACDGAAIIPMREGNESLNASAAATICIWETVRATEAER
ncbi:MAG: RNA methyltransferase [Ruminococcaceae bacterium]|nr:RNA methyltransferase [Oscillospiraceae bacterium]